MALVHANWKLLAEGKKFRVEKRRFGDKNVYLVSYCHGFRVGTGSNRFGRISPEQMEQITGVIRKIKGSKIFLPEGVALGIENPPLYYHVTVARHFAKDLPFISDRNSVSPLEPLSIQQSEATIQRVLGNELGEGENADKQKRAAEFTFPRFARIFKRMESTGEEFPETVPLLKDPRGEFRSLIFDDTIRAHLEKGTDKNIIVVMGRGHTNAVRAYLSRPELREKILACIPNTAKMLKINRKLNEALITDYVV